MLNAFSPGLSDELHGDHIDVPQNALMLTQAMHSRFSLYAIIFIEVPGVPNEYRIEALDQIYIETNEEKDLKKVSFADHSGTGGGIALPSPYLLRVHAACGRLIYLTGHAEYIGSIFREWERGNVRADGSTDLGALVGMRLGVCLPSLGRE